MELKTNLHFHTKEDPNDIVEYTLKEGIDHAAELGFDVLAVTCHRYNAWNQDIAEYAKSKGILLISGAEVNLEEDPLKRGRHTLILNGGKGFDKIETFEQLREYKKEHPEIFVIAAHPYFYGNFSLGEYLEKYIDLYDAIEHSWFYSKLFNRNKKAIEMAKKYDKPLISTSDTHFLYDKHMDRNYAVIDAEEKTPSAIFDSIRNNNFRNVTFPSSFWKHMVLHQGRYFSKGRSIKKKRREQYMREKRERHLNK